jgi:hypothetical protein
MERVLAANKSRRPPQPCPGTQSKAGGWSERTSRPCPILWSEQDQGVPAGVQAMATFRCSKCGCHEDTALCNYWSDRVRDMPPICSACDPRIKKWHGQFPRLFGVFLVTPSPGPTPRPREALASLVGRLAEASQEQTVRTIAMSGGTSYFDDPIPSYKPLSASE